MSDPPDRAPERTEAALHAANTVRELFGAVRIHRNVDADLASDAHRWTVAVPVRVEPGLPVADDAPPLSAVGLELGPVHDDARVIRPGDAMRIVGGTNGHMMWPPASRVMDVETGDLAGARVQFILEPDPRPAGEGAVLAALALLRADEPVLNQPVRMQRLRRVVALRLGELPGAPLAAGAGHAGAQRAVHQWAIVPPNWHELSVLPSTLNPSQG